MSEDMPWIYWPGSQKQYNWCFAQVIKQHKDLITILETVLGLERAGATKCHMPSMALPPTHGTQHKRTKNYCQFAIQERRAEMKVESV